MFLPDALAGETRVVLFLSPEVLGVKSNQAQYYTSLKVEVGQFGDDQQQTAEEAAAVYDAGPQLQDLVQDLQEMCKASQAQFAAAECRVAGSRCGP